MRRLKPLIASLAFFWAAAPPSFAQPGPGPGGGPPLPPPPITSGMTDAEIATGLGTWLDDIALRDGFSGVVLVAREGREVFSAAHGLANRDSGAPVTPDTTFNFGSIGKAITHVAIMQLVEAGKLKLTDTVGQWLPDYPQSETRSATIDQLLGHRGGVADFVGPVFMDMPKASLTSNAVYFGLVASRPPVIAPGEREQYCNGCYVVLGEIIARVSGETYEQYVGSNVFARAGMSTTSFTPPPAGAIPYGTPRPGSPLVDVSSWHGLAGNASGGSHAAARDLLALDTALRDGRLAGADSAAVLRADPAFADWSRSRISFAGGAPGVSALMSGGQGWTIIVLANLEPPVAERIGRAIDIALLGPAKRRN